MMARKPSTWAEEAGKYYRKNVGKNGIESFTDVLKSSDFKKQYYAGVKRGGDGESVNVPATTTAVATGEIQVPLNNITGVMKTGGMKMKKGKSMKMKKKGKMTKKKSSKNNKKRRITKKHVGGEGYHVHDDNVRCFGEIDQSVLKPTETDNEQLDNATEDNDIDVRIENVYDDKSDIPEKKNPYYGENREPSRKRTRNENE